MKRNHMYTELLWVDAYRTIVPYMVKIRTPDAYGSGFVMNYPIFEKSRREIAIATACHVIKHALDWAELVKIEHAAGNTLHISKRVTVTGLFCLIMAVVLSMAASSFNRSLFS